VCFYANTPTDIVVDINGWFATGQVFTAVGPKRVFDTRAGQSPDALRSIVKTQIPAGGTIEVRLTDLPGFVPADGVGSVSLNVVVANPAHVVFVAYPLVPWIGVTAAGYALGPIFAWTPERRRRFLLRLGVSLTLGFVALRFANVYGDPIRWSSQRAAIGTVLSCTLVAYGFSRFRIPGKDLLFTLLISTVFLPAAVTIVPTYAFFVKIGWVGTWHENPKPQWIIPLSGRWFVESMDGQRVEMGTGEISFGEDQNTVETGGRKGHRSGTVGDAPAVLMVVQFATPPTVATVVFTH